LLKLGTPAATQIFLEIGAFSAATALIARLGPVPLSGHEIALNCAALSFHGAIGHQLRRRGPSGQQLGRKDAAGARRAGWSAIVLGAGFMTCSGLVFVSIPMWISRLFSPDPVVIRTALGCCWSLPPSSCSTACRRSRPERSVAPATPKRDVSQLRRLLADRAAGRLFLMFQIRLGAVGIWIGLCGGLNDHWVSPSVHCSEESFRRN